VHSKQQIEGRSYKH